MKNQFLILLISLITFSVYGQNGAKIEFKAPNNTIDYGKVYRGEDNGSRIFEFTNTGNAPLVITDVKSTCGCTVPSKPKEPIMPGKTGEIEVKYNMALGPISKSVTVETNAVNHENGVVILKIKGEVIEKQAINILEPKKVGPMQ
jgi:hypothetical protein